VKEEFGLEDKYSKCELFSANTAHKKSKYGGFHGK